MCAIELDWLVPSFIEVPGIFLDVLFLETGKLLDRKLGINCKVDTWPALIELTVLRPLTG